ncbi:glycosyltransferase family 4 protein [Enterococcus sp. AZ192]|uniref:glycosyltransferase family 4 protein n=1 Tax=unclassified Enterococcus TaxID=2608891 RepID=UPI003D2C5355
MTKSILFIHSSAELYGSDRSLLNMIKHLDKKKYSCFVVLPTDGKLREELEKIEGCSVSIYSYAVLRRKNLSFFGMLSYLKHTISSLYFFMKYINKSKIDIVYTNTSVVFSGAITAKLKRKKSIWHIREIISNPVERKIISTIVNLFSDKIICNSNATLNSITDKKKGTVIHNVIDTDNIQIPSLKTSNKITIGMAGRINRWKGQKLFIDAANQILVDYPDVKFVIAGDTFSGEEYIKEELLEYVRKINRTEQILFLGLVNNMNDFYGSIDIFVLPSIKPEPFGLVILEAMARKIPVIATKHGGPLEIIQDDENGFLVDYENSEELVSKMNELITDEVRRKSLGEQGYLNQQTKFSLKHYIECLEKVLDEIK